MSAEEGKFRVPGVIEVGPLPGFGSVAVLATRAEAPAVLVVGSMAADAAHVELRLLGGRRCDVTAGAGGFAMLSAQGESRSGRVVERAPLPAPGAVAVATALAESAPVDVIDRMAAAAVGRRRLVIIAGVTEYAVDVDVFPAEGKSGCVVIEVRFSPVVSVIGVAARAVLSELALVGVVLCVAGDTGVGRIAILRARFMAGQAIGTPVGSS